MTFLEKGTRVCLSRRGYKGFFYPDYNNWETTAFKTQVFLQHWVGSHLSAVLIPEDVIYGNGRNDRLLPVWVKEEYLTRE